MYIVKYECDLLGDHTAPIEVLCDVDTIKFLDQIEALKFIQECTSTITKESDICPWLSTTYEIFIEPPMTDEPINEYGNIHLVANEKDFKNLL
jgi:hypothetical protein